MNPPIKVQNDDFLFDVQGVPHLWQRTHIVAALQELSEPLSSLATEEQVEHRTAQVAQLAGFCHSISWSRGWWTDPHSGRSLLGARNFGEMLALIHSEITEAFEAGSLPVDTLCAKTGFPEVAVELADVLIRLFDLICAEKITVGPHFSVTRIDRVSATFTGSEIALDDYCVKLHSDVTAMLEGHRKGLWQDVALGAAKLIDHVFEAAEQFGIPLTDAFLAKCEYNLRRPDHSLEARRAAGGKAY